MGGGGLAGVEPRWAGSNNVHDDDLQEDESMPNDRLLVLITQSGQTVASPCLMLSFSKWKRNTEQIRILCTKRKCL